MYTPTVGEACQSYSEIWRKPRGLFVSYPNRQRIDQIFSHARYNDIRCIVVSDGERILGLGDQGAGGMGIPIGKMALYTALAGIRPEWCLPILLDVGTDNEQLLKDPLYIGWRNPRLRGEQYDEFVNKFVTAVKHRWPNVLLQWEDFAGTNAAKLLKRYRDQLCTFNDDIQGTAAVATGTLLSAINVTGIPLTEQRIVVVGFGGAGIGISELIAADLRDAGLSPQEAQSRFYALDRDGLLVHGMPGIRPEQQSFARKRSEVAAWQLSDPGRIGLLDVVRNVKPTVLIGVSGQPGAFTEEAIRVMSQGTARPIIFPLSNPTSRCEATPQQVVDWTDGRALIGTGSPFGPVVFQGQQVHIDQTNNSYIFPGLALGTLAAKARHVSDGMIKVAALALAGLSQLGKIRKRVYYRRCHRFALSAESSREPSGYRRYEMDWPPLTNAIWIENWMQISGRQTMSTTNESSRPASVLSRPNAVVRVPRTEVPDFNDSLSISVDSTQKKLLAVGGDCRSLCSRVGPPDCILRYSRFNVIK